MITQAEWTQIRTLIQNTVANSLNVILQGQTDDSQNSTEAPKSFFAGVPSIGQRPKMMPYGLSSRAPSGTMSFVGRVGDHPGARAVLGHWDGNRPSVEAGETVLYNQHGQKIFLRNGKILIGSESATTENLVLGQVFKTMMSTLLDAIAQHTHTGNLGYPTGVPLNVSEFTTLKSSPIEDEAILAGKVFTEK